MISVERLPALLAEIPKGAWVALSHDDDRVISYGADLRDVVRRANENGEYDPIVTRVPDNEVALA